MPQLLKTECGTRSYMAPEVLARQTYDGAKADCWSAGVVLFIMLSGNPPFQMARPGDWWFNQFLEKHPDRFWKSHKRYSPHFPDVSPHTSIPIKSHIINRPRPLLLCPSSP